MNREQLQAILELARSKVPSGIYAVRKGLDYYELKNQPMTKSQMKRVRNEYKARGIKVYCNGLE